MSVAVSASRRWCASLAELPAHAGNAAVAFVQAPGHAGEGGAKGAQLPRRTALHPGLGGQVA